MSIEWKWTWIDEKWYDKATWKCLVEIDPKYFRPAEVDLLLWDPTKAKEKLWWIPKYTVEDMCKEMVKYDVELFKKQKVLKEHWFEILNQYE